MACPLQGLFLLDKPGGQWSGEMQSKASSNGNCYYAVCYMTTFSEGQLMSFIGQVQCCFAEIAMPTG